MPWDGHEVSVLATMGGAAVVLNRTMPKGWIRGLIHRQPVVAMSCFWVAVGISLPLVVPPIRRMMGASTGQYDAHHPKVKFATY
jgi:hypothetical protein